MGKVAGTVSEGGGEVLGVIPVALKPVAGRYLESKHSNPA